LVKNLDLRADKCFFTCVFLEFEANFGPNTGPGKPAYSRGKPAGPLFARELGLRAPGAEKRVLPPDGTGRKTHFSGPEGKKILLANKLSA